MDQKFARTNWLMVEVIAIFICSDMAAKHDKFTVFHQTAVGFIQSGPPKSQTFDFSTL